MNGWMPIETAPRDRDVLVWFDHDADPYLELGDATKLTAYAANAEGPAGFMDGKGVTIARWQNQSWEAEDIYGNGYWLPAGWFSRGDSGDYEKACSAIRWQPLPEPPND